MIKIFKSISSLLIILLIYGCISNYENSTIVNETNNYFLEKVKDNSINSNEDSLVYYLKRLKLAGQSITKDSIASRNLYIQSRYYRKLKNVDSAIIALNKAIDLSEGLLDTKNEILNYKSLITRYSRKGDYLNTIATTNNFLNKLPFHDYKNKGYAYHVLLSIEESRENYKEALRYSDSILKYYAKAKENGLVGETYIARANYYFSLNDLNNSLLQLEKAERISKELSPANKYVIHGTKGHIKGLQGDYKSAVVLHQKALSFSKQTSRLKQTYIGICYLNLADAYLRLNKKDLASKHLDSVVYNNIELLDREAQKVFYKTKLELSLLNNNIKESMRVVDSLNQFNKKDYESIMSSRFDELERTYKNEKVLEEKNRKVELESITYQRNQYILLTSLIVVLFLISTIIYRNKQRKLKFENQKALLQQRLLRSQMNPHFSFNTLSIIHDGLKKNKEAAANHLLKFSKLLRLTFDNSTKDYTYLTNEIELLENYLSMQQLALENNFDFTIHCEFDSDDVRIPPMLIQPFVENTLVHGFKTINYKGQLIINLKEVGKFILCEIDDNGCINENAKSDRHSSTYLINKYLERITQHSIEIIDKQKRNNQKGTLVKIYLPCK